MLYQIRALMSHHYKEEAATKDREMVYKSKEATLGNFIRDDPYYAEQAADRADLPPPPVSA
eukprot:8974857-Pyramimonas_sp.AAC.1